MIKNFVKELLEEDQKLSFGKKNIFINKNNNKILGIMMMINVDQKQLYKHRFNKKL